MTHPVFHAETSVKLWGGKVADYLPLHNWMDASKGHFADFRHRAMRHHAEGIFEMERVFGVSIINNDGKAVPVRYIGEQHVKEDCGGRIPTLADWLREIKPAGWMARAHRVVKGETPSRSTPSSATGETTASPTAGT